MIIDKDGKLFEKISIIDIFVVILVIALAAGTLYHFRAPVAQISSGKEKIVFYIKIQDVREFTADYYSEGMLTYDNKTGAYLGKIVNVEVSQFYDNMNNLDGTLIMTDKPEKIQIILKIEGEGIVSDQDYMLSGSYELKAGAGVSLLTKYVAVEGYILDIEE